jgi:hypothetical protein
MLMSVIRGVFRVFRFQAMPPVSGMHDFGDLTTAAMGLPTSTGGRTGGSLTAAPLHP